MGKMALSPFSRPVSLALARVSRSVRTRRSQYSESHLSLAFFSLRGLSVRILPYRTGPYRDSIN